MKTIELEDGMFVEAFCKCDEEWHGEEGQHCIEGKYMLNPGSDLCDVCGLFMWTRKQVGDK